MAHSHSASLSTSVTMGLWVNVRNTVGYVRIKGFVWHLYTISNIIMLQSNTSQLAPIAISEIHLKNAVMRTVRCRVDNVSTDKESAAALRYQDWCTAALGTGSSSASGKRIAGPGAKAAWPFGVQCKYQRVQVLFKGCHMATVRTIRRFSGQTSDINIEII